MYDDIGSNLWNEGLTDRASSAGPQSGAIANEGQEAEGLQLESDAHTEGGQVGKARGRAAERTEGLRQKAADYRFARSPAGRARAAAERGDRIFQYRSILTNAGHGSDLSAIEAEGWNLDRILRDQSFGGLEAFSELVGLGDQQRGGAGDVDDNSAIVTLFERCDLERVEVDNGAFNSVALAGSRLAVAAGSRAPRRPALGTSWAGR